ncbi:MAG: hypothetical protein COC23_08850, partial [Hyphomicrobiales bacterium]
LAYFFEGCAKTYTADFEVFYVDGSICDFEVKYLSDIENIDNFSEWQTAVTKAAAKKAAAADGETSAAPKKAAAKKAPAKKAAAKTAEKE